MPPGMGGVLAGERYRVQPGVTQPTVGQVGQIEAAAVRGEEAADVDLPNTVHMLRNARTAVGLAEVRLQQSRVDSGPRAPQYRPCLRP